MNPGTNLLSEAYLRLSKEAFCPYSCYVQYSGKFKDYGANINLRGSKLTIKLSRSWYGKDPDVQIGLMQELLCKMLKFYPDTPEIHKYNHFVKHMHNGLIKRRAEPALKTSFDRVNLQFFVGMVEQPNLLWGQESYRTMGVYDFKTDTIRMSTLLKDAEQELLDYVMFHEMLHKVNKFKKSGRKTYYHDKKFEQAESIYPNQVEIEKKLSRLGSAAKRGTVNKEVKKKFFDWF